MSISTMWEAKRSKRRSRLCVCMAGSSPVAASPVTTRKSRGPALPIYSTSITKRLTMKGLMVLRLAGSSSRVRKGSGRLFRSRQAEEQGNGRGRNRQSGGRFHRPLPGAEHRQDGGEVGLRLCLSMNLLLVGRRCCAAIIPHVRSAQQRRSTRFMEHGQVSIGTGSFP